MFDSKIVSPLDLCLDYKNPRFIIPQNSAQPETDLIKYLLRHEDALVLAKGLANIKTLLPGERIVVCNENNRTFVLEGNRRICCCKLFLNRDLIPQEFRNSFPNASDELLENIRNIEVDIIPSREEAKRYLAARHIRGVKQWSPIAKMRFSYEEYENGRDINGISDITSISKGKVKDFIRKYKILIRGIESRFLTTDQRETLSLSLLSLDVDKLLRAFKVGEITNTLKLTYDDACNLKSEYLSDEDIDKIIAQWTIKAFIENEMNTRTQAETILGYISDILERYRQNNGGGAIQGEATSPRGANPDGVTNPGGASSPGGGTNPGTAPNPGGTDTPNGTAAPSGEVTPGGGPALPPEGGPEAPSFFYALNWWSVPQTAENSGLIQMCNEIHSFSRRPKLVIYHPMTAAYQTRALIELSFKYYAKKTNQWQTILRQNNNKDPQLSNLINYFQRRLTLFPDPDIRRLFPIVFGSNLTLTAKLNNVVHQPEQFRLSPDSLLSLPQEGLLTIINYMLT